MSEKQLASSGDSFVDLTQMETVDLLNKLSDENTKLHKKVDEQQATITHLEKVNGKNFAERRLLKQDNLILRNENEQLRQELEKLKLLNESLGLFMNE